MTAPNTPPTREPTLSELATTRPGAALVFHRHGLDYCCHGRIALADACAAKGLDASALVAELERETQGPGPRPRFDERPIGDLVDHILERFHAAHREELPRLLEMARKVEQVHADKRSVPRGLAAHLERMAEELELHMQKEEQVLFPLLRAGRGRAASMPIQVMEMEHEDHARNLERLRELTDDYTPPAAACSTWRALFLGLAELERDLMEHIHHENNVLFPRALNR